MSRDQWYEMLVMQAGLYGQAFFGWKADKVQQRTLNALWKLAQTFHTM